MSTLTGIVVESAGAQRGSLLLPAEDGWQVAATQAAAGPAPGEAAGRPARAQGPDLPLSLIKHAARRREPVLLDGRDAGQPFARDPYFQRVQPRSVLCLPLVQRSELIGLFYLENSLTGDAFPAERVQFLTVLATQAAITLSNALLVADLTRSEALVRASELRFRHLFENTPVCVFEVDISAETPAILSADRRAEMVYGWSESEFAALDPERVAPPDARRRTLERDLAVGGDFYDFVDLPSGPGQVGLVIGGVTGKGIPAALFMARSCTILRTAALLTRSPAEVLRRANEQIVKDRLSELFLTAFYGILDTRSGDLTYANGGHNRPLWIQAETGQVAELAAPGMIMGAVDQFSVPEGTAHLAAGDQVVFFTDGVTEAMDGEDRLFGKQRLRQAVQLRPGGSAQDCLDAIVGAVRAHAGARPQSDDITLLVVKRLGY